jgi:hypothetical protein
MSESRCFMRQPDEYNREEFIQVARAALAEARRTRMRAQQLSAEIEEDLLARWSKLAGPRMPELLANRAATMAHLRDADAKLRQVALSVVAHIWGADDLYVQTCHDLLVADPDLDVRIVAAGSLATCFLGTNDGAAVRTLAHIVKNISEPLLLRDIAYQALFEIRGLPVESWPVLDGKSAGQRFEDDVDWSFVESCLNGK